SSRRRHTRFSRDWNSDVCSSDLGLVGALVLTRLDDGAGPVDDRAAAVDLAGRGVAGEPGGVAGDLGQDVAAGRDRLRLEGFHLPDRKSTRLNSSHVKISYAGFCL